MSVGRGWSCGWFGGVYILSDLVQMAFRCLLYFGIMFVYIFNSEERTAYIISCAYFLDPGLLYWVSMYFMYLLDYLVDGGKVIYIVGLCCGGVMCQIFMFTP